MTKGKKWEELQDQPLLVKSYASKLASEFYPNIWPDSKTFNEIKMEQMLSENERINEMLDLIRRRGGKENIIIILDEVGQYIAARDELILNLDGLSKNIKSLGNGKVWLIATAQQTLTEDDPRAVMNSAKLFKLKDRFPISIDLEASDIKEICWTRLLGKSDKGEKLLIELYEKNGDKLKFNTQIKNSKYYKSTLDKKQFGDLYPFLPHHFDILLELLGRLAKSSGGIGLRSAIKIIQDILIDQSGLRGGVNLLAEDNIGNLATTIHMYDTLKRDIQRSYKHLVDAVEKVEKIFGHDNFHLKVAKSIAVLQILENFPVTAENIAALLHPSVGSESVLNQTNEALNDILHEVAIPLSEVDGNLRFMSDAVREIEADRNKIIPHSSDLKIILHQALQDIFTPIPSTTLQGTKKVSTGLKMSHGNIPSSIFGDKETIQFICNFVNQARYNENQNELIKESQQRLNKCDVFLLAREDNRVEDLLTDIYRSNHIYKTNQAKSFDKEIGDYLKGQSQQVIKKSEELKSILKKSLLEGSFIFRGKPKAVGEFGEDFSERCKKYLSEIADEVYEKYSEAPVQVPGNTAEKFLKTEKLDKISSDLDPLSLVGSNGKIKTEYKAIISIKDYLERNGQVEGRKLLDDFFSDPFGWQKDSTRYIIAAMLVGGLIRLRISGENFTVRSDIAITNISSTNNFNKMGIALRDTPPPPEMLQRARERLTQLTGEDVLPLEEEISKIVIRHFPDIQRDLASLPAQLKNLNVPGENRTQEIMDDISEILKGDASDATSRLGNEECKLYEDILWAREVKKSFNQGIESLIIELKRAVQKIHSLPNIGMLRNLKENTESIVTTVNEYLTNDGFYKHSVQLQKLSSEINKEIKNTVELFQNEQHTMIDSEVKKIQSTYAWEVIGLEEQNHFVEIYDELKIVINYDIIGLEKLLNNQYTISTRLKECEEQINKIAREKEEPKDEEKEEVKEVVIELVPEISYSSQIDELIAKLQKIKDDLKKYVKIRINWK